MTTDTLAAEVLDEAEYIVRAEWLRVLTAAVPGHWTAVPTEMPVARPRSPASHQHRSATRRRNMRVWPTQRSPP
ncbi:hypothetical protein [Mycobacterium sp. SMC-14]|uniref:hypothetical protein n=1 Tax=Mycobacterium sp. SMC-14 TaxID=3385968 RepID=UPI00390C50CD